MFCRGLIVVICCCFVLASPWWWFFIMPWRSLHFWLAQQQSSACCLCWLATTDLKNTRCTGTVRPDVHFRYRRTDNGWVEGREREKEPLALLFLWLTAQMSALLIPLYPLLFFLGKSDLQDFYLPLFVTKVVLSSHHPSKCTMAFHLCNQSKMNQRWFNCNYWYDNDESVEKSLIEEARTYQKHPIITGYGSLGPSESSHETQLTAIPFAFKLIGTS